MIHAKPQYVNTSHRAVNLTWKMNIRLNVNARKAGSANYAIVCIIYALFIV